MTFTHPSPTGRFYVQQFGQLFDGGSWLGESFRDKLASVSAELAFAVPQPGFRSIAEIVVHCTYWRQAAVARLDGDLAYATSLDNPRNWPNC